MGTRASQGGWVGLIVLLLAVAIVALLGKTLLRQMGLVGPGPGDRSVARPGNVQGVGEVPPPAAALRQARGLEQAVQEQARENDARLDKAVAP
jgi:hypothetical protein